MASTASGLPEPSRDAPAIRVGEFHVSELAADLAGSLSPYGPDVDFPLPLQRLRYTHPSPADRPHLAEGR
jgi:succinate dehydrogenase / fumarate reductase iron-sulfur subunit